METPTNPGSHPLPNPAKQQFHGVIANTLFNSAQPPPTNPFDQRTPPRKEATVRDPRLKQASVAPPLLPSSVRMPPASAPILPPQPSAPPSLQPPAPPILRPGWEQGGSFPNLAAAPKSKAAPAYGWKGWQTEGSSPDHKPAPYLHQPKLEVAQEPMLLTGSGSLSQLLEAQIVDQRGVEESGVSPPRPNPTSALSVRLDDSTHDPIIIPPAPGQPVESSAETPSSAKQLNQDSGMVVCPLCPAPGFVLRTDLDHARSMHR